MSSQRKTECPVSLARFKDHAKPLVLTLPNGSKVTAVVKEFSTGSFGWYFGDKVTVEVDGVELKVQVGLNMTVANSKEAPRGDATSAEPVAAAA